MATQTKLNAKQIDFIEEMRSSLYQLHDQWVRSRGREIDTRLLSECSRRINTALQRLGLTYKVEDDEYWDMEVHTEVGNLGLALHAIERHFE